MVPSKITLTLMTMIVFTIFGNVYSDKKVDCIKQIIKVHPKQHDPVEAFFYALKYLNEFIVLIAHENKNPDFVIDEEGTYIEKDVNEEESITDYKVNEYDIKTDSDKEITVVNNKRNYVKLNICEGNKYAYGYFIDLTKFGKFSYNNVLTPQEWCALNKSKFPDLECEKLLYVHLKINSTMDRKTITNSILFNWIEKYISAETFYASTFSYDENEDAKAKEVRRENQLRSIEKSKITIAYLLYFTNWIKTFEKNKLKTAEEYCDYVFNAGEETKESSKTTTEKK